ncbi:MAG: YIEGIA domain-containing protein [Limnochordaceae bacterium]|nr:YIEGIA domain-containing protein [Limnochordaceae bacterium]
MLRVDYRQYPSYPEGYTIHLAMGFIAAFLGAMALPAILSHHYEAATFLALAATQFREVRSLERDSLAAMEETELVHRGSAYIEGIARTFEARNYLAMLASLLSSLAAVLARAWWPSPFVSFGAGLGIGMGGGFLMAHGGRGRRVGDVALVEVAPLEFEGPLLKVAGVIVMNVGLDSARRTLQEKGLGAVIRPHDADARATLANLGQRQAIAHDCAVLLGIHKDVDEPEFTPLVRRNSDTGEVVVVIVPDKKEPEALLTAIRHVPLLEAAIRKPTEATAGRMAQRERE